MRNAGQVLDGINKVAKPVAIISDAIQLGNAIKTDVQEGTGGDNTIVTGSKVAGGWIGAWAGAKVGGAGIGSFFPGPGTVVGGFVGGFLGAIGGAIFGSEVGETAGKKVVVIKNE